MHDDCCGFTKAGVLMLPTCAIECFKSDSPEFTGASELDTQMAAPSSRLNSFICLHMRSILQASNMPKIH